MDRRWIAAALALGIALTACNRVEVTPREEAEDPAALAAEIDRWVEDDLASEGQHAEAREWLHSDEHQMWGAPKDDVAALVDDLYTAGAEKVYVTGIETVFGKQVTSTVAVAMPDDPLARIQLFDRETKFWELAPDERTADTGQRYLSFEFD